MVGRHEPQKCYVRKDTYLCSSQTSSRSLRILYPRNNSNLAKPEIVMQGRQTNLFKRPTDNDGYRPQNAAQIGLYATVNTIRINSNVAPFPPQCFHRYSCAPMPANSSLPNSIHHEWYACAPIWHVLELLGLKINVVIPNRQMI